MKDKKILITGASGFIGSFIVEEALRREMQVWVAVRKSTNRKYLTDPRINFLELNLGNEQQLLDAMQGMTFDYVVHAAGATKCKDSQDFYRVNTEGTKNLVRAITKLHQLPDSAQPLPMLVYVSSLSIFGAIREEMPHQDILLTDTPKPNTHYGRSKLQAEEWLSKECVLPYVVLRPTGVYGPRETDYFLMAKSIKQHVDFAAGFEPQDITFVYVRDVVQAVFRTIEHRDNCVGKAYFLSDGEVYSSRTFSDLIQKELGVRFLLRLKAPLWLLRIITIVGDKWGKITGKVTALNNDKYQILRQRNWRCDISPAQRDFNFDPQWQLEQGVKEAMQWYKDNGWL